jgi:hypothetical protein
MAWMQVLYERYRATPVEDLARTPGSTFKFELLTMRAGEARKSLQQTLSEKVR